MALLRPKGSGGGRASSNVSPTAAVAGPNAASVDVWRVALDQPRAIQAALERDLTDDERLAAAQQRTRRQHERAIVARSALRRLLGYRIKIAPRELPIERGASGKPRLAVALPGEEVPQFSVSRSDELCVVAITCGCPIGVDIERLAPVDRLEALAARLLADRESATWSESTDRLEAFYGYWTCKEAYLKAVGIGLSEPLTRIVVRLSEPTAFIDLPDDDPFQWQLRRFVPLPGYTGALTVRAAAMTVAFHCWAPPDGAGGAQA